MKLKVIRKQYTSRHCFVCGEQNKSGLRAKFYETDNGEVVGIFEALFEHSGYPGRMHGGIAAAIIDETIGRAILIPEPDTYAVTLELSTQFIKPVPVCKELKVTARITSIEGRIFEGTGEILLENGEIAVTGWAKYLKLPFEKITGVNEGVNELIHGSNDLKEIEI